VTFRIHEEARAELVDAADYYEREQAGLGAEFTTLADDALRKIEKTPRRFAKLETIRFKAEIRRCLLTKFPYLVIYELESELVHVLAVAHASRRPNYWLKRRSKDS
jgi:plasmid stabilization system protein ParE